MNKKIKYFILTLSALFAGLLLVITLATRKEDKPEAVHKFREENVSKTIEQSKSENSLQPKAIVQPELPETHPQTDQPQEITEDDIFSAVFSALPGKFTSDELTDKDIKDLIKLLFDNQASPKDRRECAWSLAKNANPEILLELERVFSLEDTPPYLKAVIAEGLGYSSGTEGKKLIFSALEDEDDIVVRGAIRGLSAIGDEEAVAILSDIVSSNEESRSILAEAATGLGKIDTPEAYNALVNAYYESTTSANDEYKEILIEAIGYRDISETDEFFQKIFNENTNNPSLKLAAIEALQNTEGDTSFFLLNGLGDENSELRAEAAWALAIADEPGDFAEKLQMYLEKEDNAEVRKRLYQALGNQENVDSSAVASIVFEEPHMDARLAGYDLLAKNINSPENVDLKRQFNHIVVPELQEIALFSEKLNYRLSATITLKRANTEESACALEEISARSLDTKVVDATGVEK